MRRVLPVLPILLLVFLAAGSVPNTTGVGSRPNTTGVFTLEELLALGQSGDVAKDWMAGGGTDPLFGGFDRAVLRKGLKFPAGYYRISPTEALYVDPARGVVPKQFVDMLDRGTGDLPRDPVSGMPSAFLPDNHVWQEPAVTRLMREQLDEQRRLEAEGLTRQQAQDYRLRAQNARPADTYAPGLHNTVGASAGAYERFKGLGGTDDLLKLPAYMLGDITDERHLGLRDALAFNYMQRGDALAGLRRLRQSQGLDPETGTSPEAMQRNIETYNALAPEKRQSWLFYQDPGNLTPELRELRKQTPQYQQERALLALNKYAHDYVTVREGGQTAQFVIKYGDVYREEAGTGREKVFGRVPLKAEQIKQRYNRFGDIGRRIGGGLSGAFLGFFGSGGNPLGAALGAYQGAGGPMPQVKGWAGGVLGASLGYAMGGGWGAALGGYGGAGGHKGIKQGGVGDFRGYGSWRGSAGQIPGARELGSTVLFASMAGRPALRTRKPHGGVLTGM